jgi:hypothetical protein
VINTHGESSTPIYNEVYKKEEEKFPQTTNHPITKIPRKATREIPSSIINGPWIAPVLSPLLLLPLLPPNPNLGLCFWQCCCWSGMVFGTYQHSPDTYQSVLVLVFGLAYYQAGNGRRLLLRVISDWQGPCYHC